MSRRGRILRNTGIGLAVFLVLAFVVAISVVQTDWFREYVKQKIVTATEDATGGRVEAGSFTFDWRRLEAVLTNFVIHGKEPADAAPFVRVARVQVNLRLFTSIHRILSVSFLGAEQPQVNVLVFADGSSNVPEPRTRQTSAKTPLETVVDLAVGQFALNNGLIHFNSGVQPFDIQGNNLRVRLDYSVATQRYQGQLSMQPIYVAAGRNTPVTITATLPLTLGRDRIAFDGATVSTPSSELKISGSLENLRSPKVTAQVSGTVTVGDVNSLANVSLSVDPRLSRIALEADAEASGDIIKVSKLRVALGSSTVQATGTLKDPQGAGELQFASSLNLTDLTTLLKSSSKMNGTVAVDGSAKLQEKLLTLTNLHVRAFGGEFAGQARLEDFARYQASGNLRALNLQDLQRRLGLQPLPYDGNISGAVEAHGDLDAKPSDVSAQAKLTIAPGTRGIPIRGTIDAEYSAASGEIRARNSNLILPHTRVNFHGALREGLQVDLTSQDLGDVLAAVPGASKPIVRLDGGEARVTAVVTGSVNDPRIAGHLAATRLAIADRRFDSLASDFRARQSQVALDNGSLTRGMMLTSFAASAGLDHWSSKPQQPLSVTATVRDGDLADVLAMAGQPSAGYSGAIGASVNIGGTQGNPTGSANVDVINGTLRSEPFDRLQASVTLTDQRITLPAGFLTRAATRVDFSGDYQHARDDLETGQLTAHVKSNPVDLSSIRAVQSARPGTAGSVQVDSTASANLAKGEFQLTAVQGDVAARAVRFDGQDYGDVTANASTSGNTVAYNLTSNFAGSQIRANGKTQLAPDYPTTLDANLSGLPIERALVVARRTDIPAKGNLSGSVHFTGTVKDPQGSADLDLANAVMYDEPLDRVRARVEYLPQRIDVQQLEVSAGPSRLDLTGRFDHPLGDLNQGDVQVQVSSSRIDLARLRSLQLRRPGLAGTLQVSAESHGTLRATGTRFAVRDVTAKVDATGLAQGGKNLGNLNLAANTAGGRVNFTLESDLANAIVHGRGEAGLSGNYPVKANVTFDNLTWANLAPLVTSGGPAPVDGVTSGSISVDGPITDPAQLSASLRLTTFQVHATQTLGTAQTPGLQNQGDIAIRLEKGAMRIDSAHLTGPDTDVTATGTASIPNKTVDVRVNAKLNLAVLKTLSSDVFSSGNVTLVASVQGAIAKPQVNGRLELQNAAISYADLPAGLSNANGVVLFNGSTATIQTLTGESGGGKLTMSGFITRQETLRFGLRLNASGVRVRLQQGVSVAATANLNLTGTSQSSLASGTVSIDRVTYLPQTDIGSILTRSSPPVQAPANPSAILENMNLDIAVRTSSATSVQASLAENLQVGANLQIRGRASQPGVLGTVTLNKGDLAFFGSKYTISSGTISFYNPNRIAPNLDISLQTQAKGVTVVLNVRGPIDNLKLSYTSDPPLQFEEIVALLASGKAPTSDPTLLASQPSQPPQNFQERGESALLSKALADPVSSRLQRVFGVSELKIDPSFTSGSQLPQARVTLQQQVATNLVFTYVTALDNPNTQIVRIEWSLSPQWSAVANRDEQGLLSINLLYKKQFR